MSYKSILVMRSIPELLQGPPDSPSLGVARHLRGDASASSSSSSSSDNELAPFARAKSLPPSPVSHSPLVHPRGFLRPSASLPEEAEACPPQEAAPRPGPPGDAEPAAAPGCVPRQSVIRSLFYQQAAQSAQRGAPATGRRVPARRRHLLKGGYFAGTVPGLREPLLEHRALEEAAAREERAAPATPAPSFETSSRLPSASTSAPRGPCRSHSLGSDCPRGAGPLGEGCHEGQGPSPTLWGLGAETGGESMPREVESAPEMESLEGQRPFSSSGGDPCLAEQEGSSQDSCGRQLAPFRHPQKGPATRKGSDPPEAVVPQAPGSFPPGCCLEALLATPGTFLSQELQAPSSPAPASLQSGSKRGLEAILFPGRPNPPSSSAPASPSGMAPSSSLDTEDLAQETEGLWESEPSPPQPRGQATARKFSLGHHGGYAGLASYGAFAFGGDAGGILGQGPLWARLTWSTSQSLEEQDETGAESPFPQASELPLPEGSGGRGSQVSLVQIQDLSGDMEAADTMSLDISEVEPAYLNLSDLYDIKYLPFEFMLFRKIPKPELPPSPASSEAKEELAELPEATWSWQGRLGLPASLEIREELEDSEALFREAGGSQKRKWSPPSSGLCFPGRHALLEEPVELGLRQRVRASVVHISSLLRGRPQGDSPPSPRHHGGFWAQPGVPPLYLGAPCTHTQKSQLRSPPEAGSPPYPFLCLCCPPSCTWASVPKVIFLTSSPPMCL